jgi:hypothetical protein
MDGTNLAEPDRACVDASVNAAGPEVQDAAKTLSANLLGWPKLELSARHALASAYVGCAPFEDSLQFLAIGIINSLESAPCVQQAWTGILTPELVADSVASGTGLDDLPAPVLNQLVAGALPCVPDRAWWIDDIGPELERDYGYSTSDARCVAGNLVDRLGMETVLARRVLMVPLLTLSDEQLSKLDLAACGVAVELPPMTPGEPGDCLGEVFRDDGKWPKVSCDQPHAGEVLAHIDIKGSEWPGIEAVVKQAETACRAVVAAAAPGRHDVGMAWPVPSRQVWERRGRTATCLIGPIDGTTWNTPSGITTPTTS